MKILFDPYIFNVQKIGGISRYHAETYKQLKSNNNDTLLLPILYTDNLYHINRFTKYLGFLKNRKGFKRLKYFLKNINLILSKFILKFGFVDLFVTTYYDTYFLKHINNTPYVVTIHDMIHEIFPELFEDSHEIIKNKKILIYGSKNIITVSNSTKLDIIKFYPNISIDKIHVIPLSHTPIENNFTFEYNLKNKKYILFVGNRSKYKNFIWLITAISDWLITKDYNLICLGGNDFDNYETHILEELNLINRVEQYNFKDNELYFFYTNALAFIFPSQYEGFGIPILEAMSHNCPVILPNSSSFPEVAGYAGVFYNEFNKDEIVICLNKLLTNKDFRIKKILQGKEHLKNYSWNKTTSALYKIYINSLT
jgi:glycosyltransferase involved in cell wall biosynthesis